MNHKRTFDSWNWNDICRRGLQDQVQPPNDEWVRDDDGMPMYTKERFVFGSPALAEEKASRASTGVKS